MILIFLGPPGSGKGTQAKRLSSDTGWPHLSTGDMLRNAISAGSQVGLEAKAVIDKGMLVPDPIVVKLIAERVKNSDCRNGFILDGFPRNTAQAETLDQMMSDLGLSVDKVILFNIAQNELVSRLSGRRTCTGCSAMYHLETTPSKIKNICDSCGKELIQRSDDQPEVIRKRLSVYESETAPLVGYYRNQGLLSGIDALQSPLKVSEQLGDALRADRLTG